MLDEKPSRSQQAQPRSRPPVAQPSTTLALIVAGAVGYGLAWLIHGRAAHAQSYRHSRAVSGPWPQTEGSPHDEGTGWNQPRPSGDSPKPHGDALPNVVKAVTDNGERF